MRRRKSAKSKKRSRVKYRARLLHPKIQAAAEGGLDKSEGVVKTEISWAVREHRLLCQRRLRTKTLEISPESLCAGVDPPTIDSTYHSAMILLCEHPACAGCDSAQSTPSVLPTRATRGLLSMRTMSGYGLWVRSIQNSRTANLRAAATLA